MSHSIIMTTGWGSGICFKKKEKRLRTLQKAFSRLCANEVRLTGFCAIAPNNILWEKPLNKQTNVPFLKNKFVFLLPEVFEVRTEFVPNTEERMWGHLFLSHFWFHTEIGCSFQKAVKESKNGKCFSTHWCNFFLLFFLLNTDIVFNCSW